MVEKRALATEKILDHVRRSRSALDEIANYGTGADGALIHAPIHGAKLRIAAEELKKAIAIFDRTKWK